VFTYTDCCALFGHLKKYLEAIGAYPAEELKAVTLLTENDFANPKDIVFYKFGANYILKDSFQFGSIEYYRNIEDQKSKDPREGWSNLVISTRDRMFDASLVSGYNCYLFCGSWSLQNRKEMSEGRGLKIIKIVNVRDFAEEVRSIIGAKRFLLKKVIYDDL